MGILRKVLQKSKHSLLAPRRSPLLLPSPPPSPSPSFSSPRPWPPPLLPISQSHLLSSPHTFLSGGSAAAFRRSYYVDRHGNRHFKPRGINAWIPPKAGGSGGGSSRSSGRIYLAMVGTVVVATGTIYYTHIETIPYTFRKHCILVSPALEHKIGKSSFDSIKKQYKSRTLPPVHPLSIRVRKIASDIIAAVEEGSGDVRSENYFMLGDTPSSTITERSPSWNESDDDQVDQDSTPDSERLDESWVQGTREEGLKRGEKGFTRHLEGMEWEVIVIDSPIVNAACLPGGKIFVFSGLVEFAPSDAEIACVLGHEVAHVVARHGAESLTRHIWLALVELLILTIYYDPNLIHALSQLLVKLPFSRRNELEADHIGLLLTATAGYDPRVAPSLYEKFSQKTGDSEYLEYISTHPSGKRRGARLKDSETMQKALSIYREKIAGRGIESFL